MSLYTLKELNNKPAEIIRSLILEGYKIIPTEQTNNKRESGDIEDLNSFMKIANGYMDAVVKVREAFNMLDDLAVTLKHEVSNERHA